MGANTNIMAGKMTSVTYLKGNWKVGDSTRAHLDIEPDISHMSTPKKIWVQ